ncbi:MAG: hypothetical protein KIS86_06420 [Devosia sp.]|nr:hypothetical protein [Devosia sp.]
MSEGLSGVAVARLTIEQVAIEAMEHVKDGDSFGAAARNPTTIRTRQLLERLAADALRSSVKTVGVPIQPLETRPQGEDALEPSEIEVHEGAWALVMGTNAKAAGWVDTHALFAHQLYQDQILPVSAIEAPAAPSEVREERAQGICAWPKCTCAQMCDEQKFPTLQEAYEAAITAAEAFCDAADVEETNWTGWGDQVVPASATERRVKAYQAFKAIRDADPPRFRALTTALKGDRS